MTEQITRLDCHWSGLLLVRPPGSTKNILAPGTDSHGDHSGHGAVAPAAVAAVAAVL
ncbi:hypothetical protein [Streptomyces sp. 150FB]|uniref:hypothetical protein n=1 Tax=Streptomyces sp. 150FB TaxID=1576605 RepID=UPI001F370010|nr:hypothetical protein [Streptomyces sp. 150FB]